MSKIDQWSWTWENGPQQTNTSGEFGKQGVPTPGSFPAPTVQAATWRDSSGNLWLFGGGSSGAVWLNDLWSFSPSTGLWTWVSGSSAQAPNGVYGVQGTPADSNMPGGRAAPAYWTDDSGNFWIVGGFGADATHDIDPGSNDPDVYHYLNDLWRYSPATGLWTWVSGSSSENSSGSYGTLGTPASSNVPGARYLAMTWTDSAGNLWLFGGQGLDSTGTVGFMNDLWRFSPSSGLWTWIAGSNVIGSLANFGTQGVAASANTPGAMASAVTWTDSAGGLMLYGGVGLATVSPGGVLTAFWKFNVTSEQWEWVSGPQTLNAPPVSLGTLGVPALGVFPGPRTEEASWIDPSGSLWLFSGLIANTNNGGSSYTSDNDLWVYTP